MASRFFMSYSSSESSSEDEDFNKDQVGMTVPAFPFSDEEEETKRVVKSAKEKRYEEINDVIKTIKNVRRTRDFVGLVTAFDNLCKLYTKASSVIQKEEGGKTPRFYVKCLVDIEDFINSQWDDKENRRQMTKNSIKSLNTLRQKFRKYVQDFEDDMRYFRDNPDEEESDHKEESASESEAESDDSTTAAIHAFRKDDFQKTETRPSKAAVFDSEEDDDSDWPSESEESSSSGDDDMKKPGAGAGGFLATREKFLKKAKDKDEDDAEKKKKKERKQRVHIESEEEDDDKGGWQKVTNGVALPKEKLKMFGKDDEINMTTVLRKLSEIMGARGKKGTDRKEQIELLHELLAICEKHELGPAISVKVQFSMIMSIFDYNPSVSDPMKPEFWEKVLVKIDELLDLLLITADLTIGEHISDELENYEVPPYKMRGCVLTLIERMDEEFIKMLKACDAHSNEYIIRLRDELKVCSLVDKVLRYEEERGLPSDICRIYLRKIEHLYYKYDAKAAKQVKGELPVGEKTSLDEMERLCKYIYVRDSTDRLRTRAVLCHIYHMSLHDKWYEARDLMLMAHLQETIQHSDLPTQILYNRTMVQLGLCAFRHGTIKDAHNALLDIQSGGRAKELLAQGLLPQRQQERTTEQEKQEKQRQIPFHQHINLEMLECVYLVSAMLIEIPYMAAHEFDARRRMISKSFHHQLKISEKQSLVGPPESMREHVVAASKAMRNGNWMLCRNLLLNEKMSAKVWDLFHEANKVREMLGRKIQEESLRTYLFTYSHVYDSISLEKLSEMFDLPQSVVHAVISKMIINEEIMASLDEPSSCLVMHRTEPSSLQSLSLQLADKLYNLVDNNERILDQKGFFTRTMQTGGYRDRQKSAWGGDRNRQGMRRDRD